MEWHFIPTVNRGTLYLYLEGGTVKCFAFQRFFLIAHLYEQTWLSQRRNSHFRAVILKAKIYAKIHFFFNCRRNKNPKEEGFTAPTRGSLCEQRAAVAGGQNWGWAAEKGRPSPGETAGLFLPPAVSPKRTLLWL